MPENPARRPAARMPEPPTAPAVTRRAGPFGGWGVTGTQDCCPLPETASADGVGSRPPELVRHLTVALSLHVRSLRQAGVAVPAELAELTGFLTRSVRTRPEASGVDGDGHAPHPPRVTDRLLVTKGEAAERLGVSVRTVERLVAAGRLPLVHVERAARLRVSDLETYVHDLPEEPASSPGADDPPRTAHDRTAPGVAAIAARTRPAVDRRRAPSRRSTPHTDTGTPTLHRGEVS